MGGRPTPRVLTSLDQLGELSAEEVAGICVGPETTNQEHNMPDQPTPPSGVTPDPERPEPTRIPDPTGSDPDPAPADEADESGTDAEVISLHGDKTPAGPTDREHHPAQRSASATVGQLMDAIKKEAGCDERVARQTIEKWYQENDPDKNVRAVNRGTAARQDLQRDVSLMIDWAKTLMRSSSPVLQGEGGATIPVDPAAHLRIQGTKARLEVYRAAAEAAGPIELNDARMVLEAVFNQLAEDPRWATRPLDAGVRWDEAKLQVFRSMVDLHLVVSYWLFYLGLRLGVPEQRLLKSRHHGHNKDWNQSWCFMHARWMVKLSNPQREVQLSYIWPTLKHRAQKDREQAVAQAARSATETAEPTPAKRVVTNAAAATAKPMPRKVAMMPSKRADHEARRGDPDDFRDDHDAEAEHAEASRHQPGSGERRQAPDATPVDETSAQVEGLEPGAPGTYEEYILWLDANTELTTGQILDRAEEMFPA